VPLGGNPARAIIDSGTSLILCPRDLALLINSRLGATRSPDGRYTVGCETVNALPIVKIGLGERRESFSIHPEQYIIRYEGICISAFEELEPDTNSTDAGEANRLQTFILGDAFLRNRLVVFDVGRALIGIDTG